MRYDYEYRRNGTANLFVFLDVNRSWRKVKLTERRAARNDFAACMSRSRRGSLPWGGAHPGGARQSVDRHSVGALYQTFPADEAPTGDTAPVGSLPVLCRPKHASWLNMVEILRSADKVWLPNALEPAPSASLSRASSPRPPPGRTDATPSTPVGVGETLCWMFNNTKKRAPKLGPRLSDTGHARQNKRGQESKPL